MQEANVSWLSFGICLIPIIVFFASLVWFKLQGWLAAALTVFIATLIAIFYNDITLARSFALFLEGFLKGMWPIAWIIIAAIFLYKLSDKSGYFAILKHSVISITPDHRIQVILIAFCFGSFLEGAIGFGGPVAITAALLVGLGIRPLYAAGLCMIANTAPVVWGAVGIPIIAMAQSVANISNTDQNLISAMVGRMIVPITLFVPFFIVFLMDGFKGVKQTFPAVAVATFSFAITQFISSNYIGAELPDILSAVVSLVVTTIFLKFWKPSEIFRVDGSEVDNGEQISAKETLIAWTPFLTLIVTVVIWQIPAFKALFAPGGALHYTNIIFSIAPGGNSDIATKWTLDLFKSAGTAILLAGVITAIMLLLQRKIGMKTVWGAAGETLNDMKIPVLTIGLVVAYASIAGGSGQAKILGTCLAQTGDAFAFFSPIIGWLGVFLTGSDTSSNLLFGALQVEAAKVIMAAPNATVKEGLDTLFLAANSFGGVVGKMISPQSIAIACAAVGLVGKESDLFKFTIKYSVAFVIFCGALTWVYAHYLHSWIPLAG